MAVILEVTAGPLAGKRVTVMGGQSMTIGRTPRSNFAVPNDTFMSGVHFSVECGANGCLLTDQKSSNGTFVNKERVTQTLLRNGDEVRSGQTTFSVRVVDESKLSETATSGIPRVPVAPLPVAPLPAVPRPTERTSPLDQPPAKRAEVTNPPVAPLPLPSRPGERPPSLREPAAGSVQMPQPPVAPLPLPARPADRIPQVEEPAKPRTSYPYSNSPTPAPPPPSPPTPPAVTPAPPIPPPATPKSKQRQPVLTIGRWAFATIPERWSAQGEYGIQRDVPDAFPSSVVVTEESLADGFSLQQYVEAQLSMLRQYLREPQIDAAPPANIGGAEETIAVDVHYKTKDGQGVFYRRIYSRVGRSVGIFTFTTLEAELPQLRPALEAIVSGAQFNA